MKYASEALMREHESVLVGLEILEEFVKTMKNTGTADRNDADGIIRYIQLFGDKCHHGKEEGLLFPAMERAGIPNEGGPIGQMLREHAEGRRCIAEMAASTAGGVVDTVRFASAAERYISLIRAHTEKENTVLFPLGYSKIPEWKNQRLLERFAEFEAQVIGEGIHEEMNELFSSIRARYAK